MSKETYKIDRTKFIDWIDGNDIDAALGDMRHDLKTSGEFILTATELLHRFNEVPVHLIEDYAGLRLLVSGDECELIYKNPFT